MLGFSSTICGFAVREKSCWILVLTSCVGIVSGVPLEVEILLVVAGMCESSALFVYRL